MKLMRHEVHEITVTRYFEVDDEEIIAEFGSIEQFKEEFESTERWHAFVSGLDYDNSDYGTVDGDSITEPDWEMDDEE